MSYSAPEQFANVTLTCKANVYFDGKVISHSFTLADGSLKSVGLIHAGTYKFNTDATEKMEIIAGNCRVRIAGQGDWTGFTGGTWFDVPAKSYFEIEVAEGSAEYVCSYL